jgi:hypothetical protein
MLTKFPGLAIASKLMSNWSGSSRCGQCFRVQTIVVELATITSSRDPRVQLVVDHPDADKVSVVVRYMEGVVDHHDRPLPGGEGFRQAIGFLEPHLLLLIQMPAKLPLWLAIGTEWATIMEDRCLEVIGIYVVMNCLTNYGSS